MIYKLKDLHYYDFNVFEENKLAGRSYFIPYPSKAKVEKVSLLDERYKSSKVRCLNGEWDFIYYEKSGYLSKDFNSDDVYWDKVNVPHLWQFDGYERPFYLNTRFQFMTCQDKSIPHEYETCGVRGFAMDRKNVKKGVDKSNSVGVYRTSFSVKDLDKTRILTFLGVISSAEVYINAKYVGYSEGAHNSAEFDVSPYLQKGENELLVIVHKWSNGTYLECQDMFRNNGIFRDVLLFENEKEYIHDYSVKTNRLGKGKYELSVLADIKNPTSDLKVELVDDKNKVVAEKTVKATAGKVDFGALSVEEWNAEIPSLYTMFISLLDNESEKECIRQQVGFVEMKTDKHIFKVNDEPVKIKGVNHHDTNPLTGYYMTPAQIEKDILLIKEYNGNGVRTSHYPPDPLMLQLCNSHGLYVIDEADIECHGVNCEFPFNYDYIARNLDWKEHFWDRVLRLYQRDKNNASVLMWSMGNEAGAYACHDYCYDNLKKYTSIPIHYEGAIRSNRGSYDVISEMYQSIGNMAKSGANTMLNKNLYPEDKPHYLCEYAHAMGLGPGELEDYWQEIYKYDKLMGGCIWEMVDHAIDNAEGKYRWTYGGDHDEYQHDGNFCVDGLFYPDRRPHTGAKIMKAVYRPLRCNIVEGKLEFWNTNTFKASDYIGVSYKLFMLDGTEKDGKIDVSVAPRDKVKVDFDFKGVYCINIYYSDKKSNAEIATDFIKVEDKLFVLAQDTANGKKLALKENDDYINVAYENGEIIFNKKTGLRAFIFHGKNLLSVDESRAMATGIDRAFIDNDTHFRTMRKMAKYSGSKAEICSWIIEDGKDCIVLRANGCIKNKKKCIVPFTDVYTIDANGSIKVDVKLNAKKGIKPSYARVGKTLVLDKCFSKVTYLGMGKDENYPDMTAHTVFGKFDTSVSEMYEPYIRPQEYGNRMGTHYLQIYNEEGKMGVNIQAIDKTFNFSAKPFSLSNLEEAGHIEDLRATATYVNIDAEVCGAGSNSCGPPIQAKYVPKANRTYEYSFVLTPFLKK